MEKLFSSVGLEDQETLTVGNDSIVEIVTMDALDTEVMTEAAAIEREITLLDQVDETVVAMEEHADLMASAIEAGDVNASTAKFAVSATVAHAVTLGASADQMSVSFESAESDPAMTLKISLEEERGMIKKAIDGAKKLWVKLKKNVLKLVAKVISATNGLKKKGKALEDKVKDATEVKGGKYKTETFNSIRDKFKGAFLAGEMSKEATPNTIKLVMENALKIAAVTNLTKFGDGVLEAIPTGDVVAAMAKIDDVNIVTAKGLLADSITDEKVSKEILGKDGFSYLYRADGSGVSIFTTYIHAKDGERFVRVRNDKVTARDRDVSKFTVVLPKKSELEKIAVNVNDITSDMQIFVKNSFEFVDIIGKGFDEVADQAVDKDKGSKQYNDFVAYKALYTKSPSIAFGAVMGAYNTCKNIMYVINETIKVWDNAEDDKSKKDEK